MSSQLFTALIIDLRLLFTLTFYSVWVEKGRHFENFDAIDYRYFDVCARSVFLAKASRVYAFGFIMMIGGGLLGSYFHFSEPLTLNDYRTEEIRYQRVYLKESADKIVIVSGQNEYGLSRAWLKFSGHTNSEEVIAKLRISSFAKIWIDSRDFIMGIESENFNISPEVGLEYDNKDIRGGAKIGWIPAILGVTIIINFLYVFIERSQKQNQIIRLR